MKNCMHEAVQGGKTRIMKYLHQFLLILAISFMGELLKEVLPFPVPASIYGTFRPLHATDSLVL